MTASDSETAMRELDEAYASWKQCREHFPERTLNLALKLRALRDTHASNIAFSEALTAAGFNNEKKLSHQNGAALLAMVNERKYPGVTKLTKDVLAKTERWSPQHIWAQEIQPRWLVKGGGGNDNAERRQISKGRRQKSAMAKAKGLARLTAGAKPGKWAIDPNQLARAIADEGGATEKALADLHHFLDEVYACLSELIDERGREHRKKAA